MSSKAQTREKDYERGLRIADRRRTMRLSQDELAHRAGIGRQALFVKIAQVQAAGGIIVTVDDGRLAMQLRGF